MKIPRMLLYVLLGGGTVLAATGTFMGVGVASAEEPQGMSLRQESARSAGLFFVGYRTHRGGGLSNGK